MRPAKALWLLIIPVVIFVKSGKGIWKHKAVKRVTGKEMVREIVKKNWQRDDKENNLKKNFEGKIII